MIVATSIGDMYRFSNSPAEAVSLYEGTGFRYLDYNFYNAHEPGSPYILPSDSAWKKEVADVMAVSEKLGFRFVQAHAPGFNPKAVGADAETGLLAIRRSIEACGMLGIPNIVLHTSFSEDLLYPQDRDGYFEYNRAFLRQLLPAAEKYGVIICVENSAEANMGKRYFFMTPEEMNAFLAFVDHPLVGICWDTGHAVLRGKCDQYAELLELGKNLKAVHIQDNHGQWDEHLAPWEGILDLDSIVRGLVDIRFPGPFTFEAGNSFGGRGSVKPPLAVRKKAMELLYLIGKTALEAHHCFEN